MRAWSSSLALALLVGCGPQVDRRWAPPPPTTSGGRAVVFALEVVDGVVLFAAAAEDGRPAGPVSFDLAPAEAVGGDRLLAFVYAEGLDALGLAEGRLALGGGGSCRLERPVAAFSTPLPSGEGQWRPAALALPARVREALFGSAGCVAEEACADFVAERIDVPGAAPMRTMAALDDRILLVDVSGRFYTVTATGATRRPDLDGLPAQVVARAADGELWFGGVDGALVKGPLGGPYVDLRVDTASAGVVAAVADSAAHGTLALLIAPADAERVTVVEVHRRADGEWTRIFSGTSGRAFWWESDAVWAHDGYGLVVFGDGLVLRYDGARVRPLDFRGQEIFEQIATAATVTADGQAYIGGRRGAVLSAPPPYETWRPLEVTPVPSTVQALAAYREGVVVGGDGGFVGQHVPRGVACEGASYHGAGSHLLVALGDDLFVAGGGAGDVGAGYVMRLSPRAE